MTDPVDAELELLQRAQKFDQDALAEVYDTYSPKLYRYAMRLLGDPQLAEECVSETFSRYLRALRSGAGPREHLQAYLYRVAHNWATDQYRRQPQAPAELDDELPSDEADVLHTVNVRLQQASVRAALKRLTPEQRQVIMLKFLEGWENSEIAHALDKPVGAIKALQHRALDALKRYLLPTDPDAA